MLAPVVDWRSELAAAARRALGVASGAVDYSYSRPSRRHGAGSNIIFPSLVRPIARVAVVVDTSGSMGRDELDAAVSEVSGILQEVAQKAPVTVMGVDTNVQSTQVASAASQVRLRGGGGTDMGAGIRAAEELRSRPDVVVVITDGYTPWPAQGPAGMTTIIVVLGPGNSATPPWAKTIRRDAA